MAGGERAVGWTWHIQEERSTVLTFNSYPGTKLVHGFHLTRIGTKGYLGKGNDGKKKQKKQI